MKSIQYGFYLADSVSAIEIIPMTEMLADRYSG